MGLSDGIRDNLTRTREGRKLGGSDNAGFMSSAAFTVLNGHSAYPRGNPTYSSVVAFVGSTQAI
jgi:hypothetical protein